MAEHFPCGILHGTGAHAPDDNGCVLPENHEGPHEYIARDGEAWQWETNLECECDWCMRCEGDYCTVYWRKADSRGEVEFQSWLAAPHTPAGVPACYVCDGSGKVGAALCHNTGCPARTPGVAPTRGGEHG